MKEYFCRSSVATAVLMLTFFSAWNPAQAAVLNYYVELNTANGFYQTDGTLEGNSYCDGTSSAGFYCSFPVYPGYLTNGIKEITIKPNRCFPRGRHTFRIEAIGPWPIQQLVAYINLTRDGGTWSVPTFYHAIGEQTYRVTVVFPGQRLECFDHIIFKKFI